MRLKKYMLVICAGAFLAAGLCACGDNKNETTATTASTTTEAVTEAATTAEVTAESATTEASEQKTSATEAFFTLNEVDAKVGMSFADIKDKLGDEIKPAESVIPCGAGETQVFHYYDGFVVVETEKEGVITGLELTEGNNANAAFMGKVKVGDTPEQVKAAIGDPKDEDEYCLSYHIGDADVSVNLENGVVVGAFYVTY